MKTPSDKTLTLTFLTPPIGPLEVRWQARVTFPANADERTVLPIDVENGAGQPVSGTLYLAGSKIKVQDGKATLTYADFIRGKHDKEVWLRRPGLDPIPGSLTFA